MSHHFRRPPRRRHLARLLSRAATRFLLTRQAGQARPRPPTAPPPGQETTPPAPGEKAEQAPHNDSQSRRPREVAGRRPDLVGGAELVSRPGGAASSTTDADEAVARADLPHERRSVARWTADGLRSLVPGSRRAGHPSWDGCDERSADRGAATVWVVGGIAVVMVVVTGVLLLGAAVVARHRVEGAADLGALAAAGTAVDGERRACAEARWVVERMGAVLRSCRLSGWDALVEADVTFGLFGSAAARARAGPVELNR